MKHIRIISLMVILAGMSSCTVSNYLTTTRTARSLEIKSDIKQMPTVADLVVDTVYVRKDTTWTNTSKSFTTKAAMRELLIGAMMEKANADVIIQPRENLVVKSQSSKQLMRMEIYGYPARYRNFRTATEEDLRILNGIDPKPANYNTIYIGSGAQQGPTLSPVVGSAVAKAITPAPNVAPKSAGKGYLRKPFYSSLEMGYNLFFPITGGNDVAHGFLVNTNYLWRMKNPHIYEGMGVGVNATFDKYYREWLIPMYWHNRFYWSKTAVAPFFDFRLGAWMGVGQAKVSANNWKGTFMGGMYYAAFLGLEFGKHFNLSVGSDQFLGGAAEYNDVLFTLNVVAKIGFNF